MIHISLLLPQFGLFMFHDYRTQLTQPTPWVIDQNSRWATTYIYYDSSSRRLVSSVETPKESFSSQPTSRY